VQQSNACTSVRVILNASNCRRDIKLITLEVYLTETTLVATPAKANSNAAVVIAATALVISTTEETF
jgi:hypothetical protein